MSLVERADILIHTFYILIAFYFKLWYIKKGGDMKTIVEVGMPLKKSLIYYHDMLQKHGFELVFACITHDLYYAKNKDFDGLTEKQIKDSCIRLRLSGGGINTKPLGDNAKMLEKEKELIGQGYIKVFDTIKLDFQYKNSGMINYIQLQDIKDIGLLVYYNNNSYDNYSPEKQRKLLLAELNSYGFKFKETDLGLDKLRTFYYGKKMYSENQNG